MASSSKLSHAASVPDTGAPALPPDALFEVLLRLPAKDLCRLRAVCLSWHALTSDPHFAAEHKSRHTEPLFALTFRDGDIRGVAIVSLSGQILRRIRIASDRIELLLTHLDRLCDEFVGICIERRFNWGSALRHNCKTVTYAFGQVASTGDYKRSGCHLPTLRGPEPLRSAKFGLYSGRVLSLANLNGSLVIVDNDAGVSFDLWFLVDHKRGLWVKKYRLSMKHLGYLVYPLLILDDGRIVIFEMVERLLKCYDPTTDNLADVLDIRAMGLAESQSIGVYTGSLLI
ncbi:unnamed protein product [Miscanthus lutarioriparius]|uniref:F-box domain-containing protein n=1 Tax=Miscanthus lutarioriparius TaxID=422564 RepID=A0A811QGL1_9POAL|nr:unnamed protein product [Miscanthus lutarioriparius]